MSVEVYMQKISIEEAKVHELTRLIDANCKHRSSFSKVVLKKIL